MMAHKVWTSAKRCTIMALLTGVAVPAAAAAQPAGTLGGDPPQAPENTNRSDDIIVTATKRAVNVQDIPVSVAVVSEALLKSNNITSPRLLPQIVPGVQFNPTGEAKLQSFSIRGVGTIAVASTLEPSVGVAINGMPLGRVGTSLSDLVDIERVEVLKGPQGILFGKNATAGLINIATRKPVPRVLAVRGTISYGSFDETNIDAAVNVPIGDSAAVRVVGWRFRHDGFVLGLPTGKKYGNKNSYGGRASFLIDASDDLRVILTGEYTGRDENGQPNTARLYRGRTPFARAIEPHEISQGIVPSPENRVTNFVSEPFAKSDTYSATATLEYDIGTGYQITSVTAYHKAKTASIIDPFATSSPLINSTPIADNETYRQYTQELRLTSPSEKRLSFVVGLFYYNFKLLDVQHQVISGIPVPGLSRYGRRIEVSDKLENYAAFGEATFNVTDELRLTAGMRQSHDRTSGTFDRQPFGTDRLPILPTVPIFGFSAPTVDYDNTSWRFGAQYDVLEDAMVYVSAARGYKGPAFNLTLSLTPQTIVNETRIAPELATSFEAGVRSQWFGRRLTVNATVFDSKFTDFQAQLAFSTAPPVFVLANAKKLVSRGVEVEVSARATEGLQLSVSGAYIDAHYADFTNASCYAEQPTLPIGSPLTPGFCVGGIQSLNGAPLGGSPKWSFNANGRYEKAVSAGLVGFIEANYNYRSSIIFNAQNNPLERQGGFGVLNVNIGAHAADDRWSFSLYARNLTKQYFVARIHNNSDSFLNYPTYQAQRQFGGILSFRL